MQVTDAPETAPKRAPGRPKGHGKSGGRKKPPQTPEEMRTVIARSRTWESLATIAAGGRVKVPDPDDPTKAVKVVPPLSAQLSALRVLADRLLPVLRAAEISGPAGGPVQVEGGQPELSDFEVARRLSFLLARGLEAQRAAPLPLSGPVRLGDGEAEDGAA